MLEGQHEKFLQFFLSTVRDAYALLLFGVWLGFWISLGSAYFAEIKKFFTESTVDKDKN